MIDLNEQQQRVLERGDESAPRVRDPETGTIYVLVREDVYQKMQQIVDGFARSAGWDDPELDVYEEYRKKP